MDAHLSLLKDLAIADLTPDQIAAIRKVVAPKPIDTRRFPALRDIGKPAASTPEPPKKRALAPPPEDRAASPVSLPRLACLKDYVRDGDVRPTLPPTAHERGWARRVTAARSAGESQRKRIEEVNRQRLIAAIRRGQP